MSDCSTMRLVYIAPRAGESGVGDYAEDFIAAVRGRVGSVVEYRHDGPGKDSLVSILRQRREVLRLIAEDPANTVVHAEQSGGALLPFWATVGVRDVPVAATVHDPPLSVWWPFRTRLAANIRLLNHGLHYLTQPFTTWLEARVNRGRTLVTLSHTGATELRKVMTGSHVVASSLFVPDRPEITPVVDRPLAIGLFGYVYRGKGFEVVQRLREQLDDDILIRVAGRGTEKLDPIPGVEILGEVDGEAEDAFFASIRMLLVPYDSRHVYGREAFPAASVVSRAMAYATPVLCRAHGALTELAEGGGAVVVDGGAVELAATANLTLRDETRLEELERGARDVRWRHSAERIVDDFLAVWGTRSVAPLRNGGRS
ncbi:hypothetical protein M2152_001867 [Microbacteriaceae bacterium SG_E_30_P1]|uniref:Glycosyltransferase involved in cell wall biosynthesis n=1 Tax=Antiquaquibacter oligotrophicus TaxID=2880260 RepID=A0ABT6KNW9_9MICO|nr:hypothetical protein [Antiquaquibacter oligotrophicus]MDH6181685.1 hypothetical protein [Antiquaquibacter oligotrophicus]UDF12631.1 hypothetical protein LH407_10765 [Antiquaquibacter oligotrophicus]